jgi:hypothetical protein
MSRVLILVIVVVSFAACAFVTHAAPTVAAAADQLIDPAAIKAELLKAQAKYAIWLTREMHPDTRFYVAPTYTQRFYRQRIGAPKGELIYELDDTSVRYLVAVRDDGAVLVKTRRQLHFIPARGSAVIQELGTLECLAVYPDGLLAEDWSARASKNAPIYFVPFDGERLRVDQWVKIVEPGVKEFSREDGLDYPAEPYRYKNVLAWIVDSTLHTFDLKSHASTSVKLAIDLHPSYRVSAFDGSTLVSGHCAFDAVTGRLLGELTTRSSVIGTIFAVQNHLAYYIAAHKLWVIDLAVRDTHAAMAIHEAEPLQPMQDDEGVTVWDGTIWIKIPWLKNAPHP